MSTPDPRKCPFCKKDIYPEDGYLDQCGVTRLAAWAWRCTYQCGYVRIMPKEPLMTKKASGYWWDVDPAYVDALRREREKREQEEQRPQLELPLPPPPVEKKEEPKPGSVVIELDI